MNGLLNSINGIAVNLKSDYIIHLTCFMSCLEEGLISGGPANQEEDT